MKVKMFAFDLDGTLLNDEGRIGTKSRKALRQARKEGILVSFVTGRNLWDVRLLGKECLFADYLIYCDGATIYDMKERKLLHETRMDQSDCEKLIRYCLEGNYQLYVVDRHHIKINKLTPGALEYYQSMNTEPVLYSTLKDIDIPTVTSFFVSTDMDPIREFVSRECSTMFCLDSQPGVAEILDKSVSKWNGIRILLRHVGIEPSQVLAAGNYLNDIDMLRNAGIGAAVKNAHPDVIPHADYVTERDNNQDIVAELFDRFVDPGRKLELERK